METKKTPLLTPAETTVRIKRIAWTMVFRDLARGLFRLIFWCAWFGAAYLFVINVEWIIETFTGPYRDSPPIWWSTWAFGEWFRERDSFSYRPVAQTVTFATIVGGFFAAIYTPMLILLFTAMWILPFEPHPQSSAANDLRALRKLSFPAALLLIVFGAAMFGIGVMLVAAIVYFPFVSLAYVLSVPCAYGQHPDCCKSGRRLNKEFLEVAWVVLKAVGAFLAFLAVIFGIHWNLSRFSIDAWTIEVEVERDDEETA